MTETINTTPLERGTKKGAPIGMIAVSIILAVVLVFLVFMYFDQKNKMIEMDLWLWHLIL
jgi:uncharacterized membrane protein YukC